jgi:cobaltochelatase CobS
MSSPSTMDPKDRFDSKGREKVQCRMCDLWYHRLDVHISTKHGIDTKEYARRYPGAPTISDAASKVAASAAERRTPAKAKAPAAPEASATVSSTGEPEVYKIGVARLRMRTDLTEVAKAYVPAHDKAWNLGVREREQWEYLALGLQAQDNVLIVGPTGCGKSTGVLQLAAVCNVPLRRVNLHGDVRAADFVGDRTVTVDPKSGQAIVKWEDGVLIDAMRHGYWLLLDELDAAPSHILFVLQSVLEPGRSITLTANNGEVVKAHPDFRIIATANTLGRGDDSGMYTGTNLLNEAFLDRFGVVITASYPVPGDEAAILFGRSGLNKDDCSKMVEVAEQVRKLQASESVYATFSTRRLVSWATKAVLLGNVRRAATITVLNRLGADDRKVIDGLIQRKWGGSP